MMIISDLQKEKIKAKYGPIFEIVNSVKDKESLELVKPRVLRTYPKVTIKEDFYQPKVFTPESREKIRQSKLGKPRPDWVREKISSKMKGKSNFEGKQHREGSKRLTSESMKGNENVKDKKWIYNPKTDVEKRVENVLKAPEGFRVGRDPEHTENLVQFTSL